jgi:hypothetical protein
MTIGTEVKNDQEVNQDPAKAKLGAVNQQTKEPAQRENAAGKQKYITNTEALQLVKEVQKITGQWLPILPTSKGGKVQVVQPSGGKAFFLYHDATSGVETKNFGRAPISYYFNELGFYTHSDKDSSPRSASGGVSQELLKDLKAYVKAHKKP